MRNILIYSFCILGLILLNIGVTAETNDSDEWGEWEEDQWQQEASAWQTSGFYEFAYGQRLQTDPSFDSNETLNDVRAHFETTYKAKGLSFNFKADAWYDGVLADTELDIRELNFSFSPFANTDLKVGRQISTWGTGDLLFLNDLFPKDWQSFFSGREDTYLKAPSDSIRVTSYFDKVNVDLVWTPEFQSDRYLNGERFSFFSPLVGNNIGGQDLINPVLPSKKINNGELALRLYKNINGIEYAAYAYRGFDKQPVGLTNELQATFYRRNTFGGSLRGPLGSGLFNLEISYNDSIQDSEGNNPLVSNSQWRFLIGYERELVSKLTWSSQFYLERMNQYQQLLSSSPFPQYESEKNRQLITQRFRYRAMQDKLTLGLFIFYSPTDDDAYLRPSVNYRQNDNWSYSLGANIFEGQNRNSFFGQFEDSTNSYIRIRYNF